MLLAAGLHAAAARRSLIEQAHDLGDAGLRALFLSLPDSLAVASGAANPEHNVVQHAPSRQRSCPLVPFLPKPDAGTASGTRDSCVQRGTTRVYVDGGVGLGRLRLPCSRSEPLRHDTLPHTFSAHPQAQRPTMKHLQPARLTMRRRRRPARASPLAAASVSASRNEAAWRLTKALALEPAASAKQHRYVH